MDGMSSVQWEGPVIDTVNDTLQSTRSEYPIAETDPVIAHEHVQETGSDPLYPRFVVNTGSPEGRYVVELSRKLLLPFDPPIL